MTTSALSGTTGLFAAQGSSDMDLAPHGTEPLNLQYYLPNRVCKVRVLQTCRALLVQQGFAAGTNDSLL